MIVEILTPVINNDIFFCRKFKDTITKIALDNKKSSSNQVGIEKEFV
jgi:hypothetical protein